MHIVNAQGIVLEQMQTCSWQVLRLLLKHGSSDSKFICPQYKRVDKLQYYVFTHYLTSGINILKWRYED
jgi:hypothetical protein